MKCKFCGKEIEDGSVFCGYCGKKQPQVKNCVKCGREINLDCKWCRYCGASQDAPSSQDKQTTTGEGSNNVQDKGNQQGRVDAGKVKSSKDSCQTSEPKKRSHGKKVYVVGGIILLLIVLGGLGFFAFHHSQTGSVAKVQIPFVGDGHMIEVRGHVKRVEDSQDIPIAVYQNVEFLPDGKMKTDEGVNTTRNSEGQIVEYNDCYDQRKYTYDSKGRVATFSEFECTIYNKGWEVPNLKYTYHYDDNDDIVSADVDIDYQRKGPEEIVEVFNPKRFQTKLEYNITSRDSCGNWTVREITGQYVSLEPDGNEKAGRDRDEEVELYYKHVDINITQKRKIFYY